MLAHPLMNITWDSEYEPKKYLNQEIITVFVCTYVYRQDTHHIYKLDFNILFAIHNGIDLINSIEFHQYRVITH